MRIEITLPDFIYLHQAFKDALKECRRKADYYGNNSWYEKATIKLKEIQVREDGGQDIMVAIFEITSEEY